MDSTLFDLSAARKAARVVLRKEHHKEQSVRDMAAKAARDAKFMVSLKHEPTPHTEPHLRAAYVAGSEKAAKAEKEAKAKLEEKVLVEAVA